MTSACGTEEVIDASTRVVKQRSGLEAFVDGTAEAGGANTRGVELGHTLAMTSV
jgi:hypothetical protein